MALDVLVIQCSKKFNDDCLKYMNPSLASLLPFYQWLSLSLFLTSNLFFYAARRNIKNHLFSFTHEEQALHHHIHPRDGTFYCYVSQKYFLHEQVIISHNDTQKHTYFSWVFPEGKKSHRICAGDHVSEVMQAVRQDQST